MTLLNFPDTPAIGDKFPTSPVAGFPQYTWDGEKWTIPSGLISPKQPVYNDGSVAMTAALTLSGDPVNPTDASDKSYVDVTSAAKAAAAIAASGLIKTVKRQIFSANGTYTPSAGMAFCMIHCVGGGGGGGGVVTTAATQFYGAAGGSCGAEGWKLATAAMIGASQPVTIGPGGAGGVGNTSNGQPGGTTSVGTLCTAPGGGGATFTSNAQLSLVPALAASGTTDIVNPGRYANPGMWFNLPSGSCAVWGGHGASGPFGGPGLGASGNVSGASGGGAVGYGSGGGGGAVAQLASGTVNGGAGMPGVVVIDEYCTQ